LFLCVPFTSLSLLFLTSFPLFLYFIAFSGIPSLSVQFTAGPSSAGDPAFCCSMRMSGEICFSRFHAIFRPKYSFKKIKRLYIRPNKLADHVKKSSNAAHLRERVTEEMTSMRSWGHIRYGH